MPSSSSGYSTSGTSGQAPYTPTYTALDILRLALMLLRVIGPGEDLSAAQYADCLKILNMLIGRWNADPSLQITLAGQFFSAVPGVFLYTIGPTGTWQGVRPLSITTASTSFPQGNLVTRLPLHILTQEEEYGRTPLFLTASYPQNLTYFPTFDPGDANNGVIILSPTPTQTCTIEILGPTQIPTFAATSAGMYLPDAYLEALVSNLALRLAPAFGKAQDPAIVADAGSSVARLRTMNYRPIKRDPRADRRAYWDYTIGEYR